MTLLLDIDAFISRLYLSRPIITFLLLFVVCTLHFKYEHISQDGTQLCFPSRARAL